MWCEIDQKDSKLANLDPIDISPEPKKDYEVRLIVWKAKDIEMMDFEGTSDAYFRSFLNPDKDQMTDTHYRCQDGNPSFNWRSKFNVQSLEGDYVLTVQAWDWDLIGGDELIGECQFDIGHLMDDAVKTDKVRSMNYDYFSKYFKQALL
jgi:Ca2+-dependent lipid-binding protein